jgi:hypothetical protein
MKVILSRKGFDSEYGGYPSPYQTAEQYLYQFLRIIIYTTMICILIAKQHIMILCVSCDQILCMTEYGTN